MFVPTSSGANEDIHHRRVALAPGLLLSHRHLRYLNFISQNYPAKSTCSFLGLCVPNRLEVNACCSFFPGSPNIFFYTSTLFASASSSNKIISAPWERLAFSTKISIVCSKPRWSDFMFCCFSLLPKYVLHQRMFVSSGSNEDIYHRCVAHACSFLIYHRVRYLICLLK
jgi:hypothetical protein